MTKSKSQEQLAFTLPAREKSGRALPVERSSPAEARRASGEQIDRILGGLMSPAVPTKVFTTYWKFAAERQEIFFRRLHGEPPPWSNDSTLCTHRFTNAYRAADRVSQYLLSQVIYDRKWTASDTIFRTLLFKFFNRVSTWEILRAEFGEPTWREFSIERYSRVLGSAINSGQRIYSAAYIMPSGGPHTGFKRKHDMHLNLLARMMRENLPGKLTGVSLMSEAFAVLRGYPTIGDFLGYQFVTDINYSPVTNFSEMEFVIAGPGAREGIAKCFRSSGGKDHSWIIRRVAEIQDEAFAAVGLTFRRLGNRPLQLIDCQNLFCEVAKYARVHHPEFTAKDGRTRIKQRFSANDQPVAYYFPPKWQIAPLS